MAQRTHQFPKNIGINNTQPFMILTSYESKNSIFSVGQRSKTHSKGASPGKPLSSIALYIPPNALRQTTTSNWEGVERGALKAGATDFMSGGAVELDVTGMLARVGIGAFDTVKGEIAKQFDKQTGMLSAGAGLAVNNHMSMAYKGPGQFREHEFAFNFFPKSQPDAEDIRKIIFDFKNGMLPRMSGGWDEEGKRGKLSSPFFRSPRHWDIEFFHVVPGKGAVPNPYLLDIKKSVITSMTVNHDPNSVVSLHIDGTPVQTTLSLTFREIEFPISRDTGGEDVDYQTVAKQSSPDYGPHSKGTLEVLTSSMAEKYKIDTTTGLDNQGRDLPEIARANRNKPTINLPMRNVDAFGRPIGN